MILGDALKTFVQSGVAVVIGTRDGELAPEIVRGWGPRVLTDARSVEVFLDRVAAAKTVANAYQNGQIAMNCSSPTSYQAVQLKGRLLEVGEPGAGDLAWVEQHREAFAAAAAMLGLPPQMTRRLWSADVLRLRFAVDEAYDQTPGPVAGRAL